MLSSGNNPIEKVLLNVDFKKAAKFYDLGSGNGKLISRVAKQHPHLECIGIEYNIISFALAKIRNIFSKQKVNYQRKDFFKTDISDADIVYVYLFPRIIERLEKKFSHELKRGALVVCNSFRIKSRKPKKIIWGKTGALDTLYIYEY